MQAVFDPPKPGRMEGFDRILELREEDQPKGGLWTRESLQRLVGDMGRWGHVEIGMGTGIAAGQGGASHASHLPPPPSGMYLPPALRAPRLNPEM